MTQNKFVIQYNTSYRSLHSICYNTSLLKKVGKLTLFQLVVHYDQKGHRNHEEVEDEADLTQLADGRPAYLLHHRLVGALTADGRGKAQDDEPTDQEHQGDLSR